MSTAAVVLANGGSIPSSWKSENEGSIPSSWKSEAMAFCSVCLDPVAESEERSIAKLKCGHHFHLDCIGSAFNAKGRMQCPNCRQVEQGRWLFANACCLHEDLVEDLSFEVDADLYNAAAQIQFSHTPWCPHYQGLYQHFSWTMEELDDYWHGYLDPQHNVRHGLQVVAGGRPICPYHLLAAQRLPLRMPPNHHVTSIGFPGDLYDNANHGLQDASPGWSMGFGLAGSHGPGSATGGSPQSYRHIGWSLQPNFRHPSLGFLTDSTPGVHNQGADYGGLVGQAPQNHHRQRSFRHSHSNPSNSIRRGGHLTRRIRYNNALHPNQRVTPVSWAELPHGHHPWAGLYPPGHGSTQVFQLDGQSWAPGGSHVGPWTREGLFLPPQLYGTAGHWWPWLPSLGASRDQVSSLGFVEHFSEGPCAWVFSNF